MVETHAFRPPIPPSENRFDQIMVEYQGDARSFADAEEAMRMS